ncbi:uncharacterized protein LOC115628361 [Scaptodrosophila lebanonensis]|uniref:Uncharacterized protein LOC115628361 n=1 Tax=Drosophila lebanonensis TaxID=7225 RepID=A0A6J2TYT1_DROLE|nr:uncharacterized protein LOC115628361 [Scaptodrosophila lebanonensis]
MSDDDIASSFPASEESQMGSADFEMMLYQALDIVGEPASKEVILRMLSTTTDKSIAAIVNDVDHVIDSLLAQGRLVKHKGKYTLIDQEEE